MSHPFTRPTQAAAHWGLLPALLLLSLLGACDGNGPQAACGQEALQEAPVEAGTFVAAVQSADDCHVLRGTAAFGPDPEVTPNRSDEPTALIKLAGTDTRLTLWFAREGQNRPAAERYRIADLPDEPTSRFETRFITNETTFSVMGVHVSGHQAFSEGGTLTIEASEGERITASFEIEMDLKGADEGARLKGRFTATPADLGFPIIL